MERVPVREQQERIDRADSREPGKNVGSGHRDFGPDVTFIDRALHWTFDRCRVDPRRICLGGFSDGASYALSLGMSNGDLFSHLMALSPGFLTSGQARRGTPPVWVSHGSEDRVLAVGMTRDRIVPSLREAGHEVTWREHAGGHQVPPAVARDALDWFVPVER